MPEISKTAEEIGCQLAISFHATTDEIRNKLVPINKKWNIAQLLETLKSYPKVSNSERITFEYVMLKGVNDSDEDARRLVQLIKGIPAKINLIPFNEWPGSPFERSDWKQIKSFADIIYKAGYASPLEHQEARTSWLLAVNLNLHQRKNENLKKMQCHIPEHRKLIIFQTSISSR